MYGALLRWLGATEQSIGRFLIVAMALGFASLIAVGLTAAWAVSRDVDHTYWVNHTYEVELAVERASVATEQAEASRRGYILTGNPLALTNYARAAEALPDLIEAVGTLTQDNPAQQRNIARLRELTAALQEQRERTNQLVSGGRRADAVAAFNAESGAHNMRAVRSLSQAMSAVERRLLIKRDANMRASIRTFYAILIVAGVLLLAVALLTLFTVLRYTRDLGASRDALRALADSREDQIAERTADLSRANAEIQRFAYIVSHDLRAPLVNVMGFTAELDAATTAIAELIDRAEQTAPAIVTEEARTAAREDLPEAIGFIRSSTQKMDRLINAILKLSREGRRVIAPEPIDMAVLIAGIEASLRHVIDERGATLAIDGALPRVVSDRLSVEQILSNLIENAVKYLQPGRPGRIVARGARQDARVMYEIEDNGRGIAAADHERVFDLFRRSGNQDQPGEGIGLAHVRALAYRLGGTIDVRSELGTGTVFRLTLPATLTDIGDR